MKSGGFVCQLDRSGAFACQPKFPDSLYTFHTLGHPAQLHGGAVTQPETVTGFPVDEFIGTVPGMEVWSSSRFFFEEFLHFFLLKQIIAIVDWLIADSNFRHVTNGFATAFHKDVFPIQQITVDIIYLLIAVCIVQLSGIGVRRYAESDNHTMHMSLDFRFAVPSEGTVGKINVNTVGKQGLPKIGDTLPLGNRIGGNKS